MTKKIWVINSSPLIILGKLNILDLIVKINYNLVIPKYVYDEINQGTDDDNAKCWINSKGKKYVLNTGGINPYIS